jgi:hypothetical protein
MSVVLVTLDLLLDHLAQLRHDRKSVLLPLS